MRWLDHKVNEVLANQVNLDEIVLVSNRRKERCLAEIIEKVNMWRHLYDGYFKTEADGS